ncbi:hypothetical protein GPK94_05815 [Pseudoflavonifractor sp. MCC625]|nr:hypothetical protein [Pseudoflavonifractor sp. MCC625]
MKALIITQGVRQILISPSNSAPQKTKKAGIPQKECLPSGQNRNPSVVFLWSNEKSPQFSLRRFPVLVDLIGIEPTTLRMRTVRSRKVVSFLPTDCGVWSAKNESCSRCFLCKFHLTQRIRF